MSPYIDTSKYFKLDYSVNYDLNMKEYKNFTNKGELKYKLTKDGQINPVTDETATILNEETKNNGFKMGFYDSNTNEIT